MKVMEAVLDKEEDIKGELNVFLNHAHHPNIVDFHGAFLKRNGTLDDHLWLVMEVRAIIKIVMQFHSSLFSVLHLLISVVISSNVLCPAVLSCGICHRPGKGNEGEG